jgi:hypothetical protein
MTEPLWFQQESALAMVVKAVVPVSASVAIEIRGNMFPGRIFNSPSGFDCMSYGPYRLILACN